MQVLFQLEFKKRGEWYDLVHTSSTATKPDLLAFAWIDWNQQYFLSSSSLFLFLLDDGELQKNLLLLPLVLLYSVIDNDDDRC